MLLLSTFLTPNHRLSISRVFSINRALRARRKSYVLGILLCTVQNKQTKQKRKVSTCAFGGYAVFPRGVPKGCIYELKIGVNRMVSKTVERLLDCSHACRVGLNDTEKCWSIRVNNSASLKTHSNSGHRGIYCN